jgi:hypothetical protein
LESRVNILEKLVAALEKMSPWQKIEPHTFAKDVGQVLHDEKFFGVKSQ